VDISFYDLDRSMTGIQTIYEDGWMVDDEEKEASLELLFLISVTERGG